MQPLFLCSWTWPATIHMADGLQRATSLGKLICSNPGIIQWLGKHSLNFSTKLNIWLTIQRHNVWTPYQLLKPGWVDNNNYSLQFPHLLSTLLTKLRGVQSETDLWPAGYNSSAIDRSLSRGARYDNRVNLQTLSCFIRSNHSDSWMSE